MRNPISIKLETSAAGGVHPATFPLSKTAKFISLFNDVLLAVDRDAADSMAIESIEDNCVKFNFTVIRRSALLALAALNLYLNGRKAMPLDFTAKTANLKRFLASNALELEVLSGDRVKAKLTSETQLRETRMTSHQYHTTLYGELIDVGGKKPNAHVKPLSGDAEIICPLSKELARELAPRLYTIVGLIGEATMENGALKKFRVEALSPYNPEADNPFIGLADIVGDAFDDVDPDEYVRNIRG